MIESWIDNLAKVCGTIEAGKHKLLRAYRMYQVAEMPESLTEFPCALQFIESVQTTYSATGVCTNIWRGLTEFHLSSDLSRRKLPEILLFYGRIRNAFAANITLYGSVAYCLLDPERTDNIEGPLDMKYGNEASHFGLVAHWIVKEVETGVTVS